MLRPRDERPDDVRAMIARLQPRLDALPGVAVHLQPVQDIQIGTRPGSTQFQYTLMAAPDPVELAAWAPRLVDGWRHCRTCATSPPTSATAGSASRSRWTATSPGGSA